METAGGQAHPTSDGISTRKVRDNQYQGLFFCLNLCTIVFDYKLKNYQTLNPIVSIGFPSIISHRLC